MSVPATLNKRTLWNLNLVKEEASLYSTRAQFKKGSRGAYNFSMRNNILDEVCVHMIKVLKTWDLKTVRAEAKKSNTRTEFQKNSIAAYKWARRNGKLDSVCKHMTSTSGFQRDKTAILYYLLVGKDTYKIGITNRTVKERFGSDFSKITILAEVHYLNGGDAADREKEILSEYSEFKYTGEAILKDGNTELFTKNILGI